MADDTPPAASIRMFLGPDGGRYLSDAIQKWGSVTPLASMLFPPLTEEQKAHSAARDTALDTLRTWAKDMLTATSAGPITLAERIIHDHAPIGDVCEADMCREGEFDDYADWPCPVLRAYGRYLPDWPADAAEALA